MYLQAYESTDYVLLAYTILVSMKILVSTQVLAKKKKKKEMLNEYLLSVIENVFHQVNINKSFINFIRRAHTLPSTLVTRETNVINNNHYDNNYYIYF